MCTRFVPGCGGGDRKGEVWFQVSSCISTPVIEEGP